MFRVKVRSATEVYLFIFLIWWKLRAGLVSLSLKAGIHFMFFIVTVRLSQVCLPFYL